MIGTGAILMDVFFVALGLFFLTGASWEWIRSLRRAPQNVFSRNDRTKTPAQKFLILVLVVIWCGAVGGQTVSKLRFYSEMSHLQPETVERIEVGSQAVTDRQHIEDIVAAINQADWYSSSRRDRAAGNVSFVLKLTSGKRCSYRAIGYLEGEGAALSSQRSGWFEGEVFCRRLPESLQRAGVTLPVCGTEFGKPRCAVQ
jgi:hypothetical protein